MYNPLEQFKILILLDLLNKKYDISLNMIIFLLILFILSIIIISINKKFLYFLYILSKKLSIEFINVLSYKNSNYLPFVLIIFYTIWIINSLGLIPYSFTLTSQIIVTFYWSLLIMIAVTYIGFKYHGIKFFNLFIPSGVPVMLLPIIFIIELISYISRIFSLSVRITANMLSGHILIYILTFFGINFMILLQLGLVLPILIIILLLEIGVSFIQAYVFAILIATYIKDSIDLH